MIHRLARQMSFFAPAAVMSAWAVVMLHTIASGHINRLLSPMFRPYVLVAAILLLILSALHLLLYEPEASETAPTFPFRDRLRQIGRWLVLLLPVIAASMLSPPALSGTTFANRALASTAGVTAMPNMSDNSEAIYKAAHRRSQPTRAHGSHRPDRRRQSTEQIKAFDGRQVRTVGLFSGQGGSAKLVRWIMWCCAADAQPASVALAGDTSAAGLGKDATQWVEVIGTARFPSTLGHVVPQIEIESIKPAPGTRRALSFAVENRENGELIGIRSIAF